MIVAVVILNVFIFAGLIFVMRRIMGGHAERAVQRLQKLNEENLRRELELKRKLDEAEKTYKQRVSDAEKTAEKIRETAQKEAMEMKERITSRANDERNEIIADGRDEIKEIKAQALKETEISALDKMGDAFRLTLSQELNKSLHDYFLNKILGELASIKLSPDLLGKEVHVTSPYPLDAEQKRKLQQELETKIKRKTDFKEEIDPKYMAGLYIRIGDVVIDGTLYNKIRQTVDSLKGPAPLRFPP